MPGRSSIYRALVRHELIDPKTRRRKKSDYKRWERARAMELWQLDVTGGVVLADGTRLQVLTGIDDHSRFCVSAKVLVRPTARPVCRVLVVALSAAARQLVWRAVDRFDELDVDLDPVAGLGLLVAFPAAVVSLVTLGGG